MDDHIRQPSYVVSVAPSFPGDVVPMTWTDWPWIERRQKEYDKRVAAADPPPSGGFTHADWDLHQRIVAEIDALPYEQGGRRTT